MTKNSMLKTLLAVLPFVFVNAASGAGFALYEFSARGNAMGGAVAANKAEAASLAVNPALITQIEGTEVQVGATFVIPQATTTVTTPVGVGPTKSELKDRVFVLPNFYATYQTSDNVFLGLAGFSRFGLGGEYKNSSTWRGSTMAYKFDVLSYSIAPTIAVKANEELSLAMGLEAMWLDFSEEKFYGPLGTPAKVKVQGDGVSWGGNFSAFYKPQWAEKFGFGLSYRTKMRQVLDGTLSKTSSADEDVRGSVTLPDSLTFGVSYAATEKLVVEAGVVGTFWSSYDAIRIDYKANTSSIVEPKNYKDVYRLNLGAEYALNKNWDIRGGYVFDKSPTNDHYMDTLVPVGDRNIFSAGAGYKHGNWGVDFSYSYLLGKDMSGTGEVQVPPSTVIPANVKYTNADTHMIGLTFKYAFAK